MRDGRVKGMAKGKEKGRRMIYWNLAFYCEEDIKFTVTTF